MKVAIVVLSIFVLIMAILAGLCLYGLAKVGYMQWQYDKAVIAGATLDERREMLAQSALELDKLMIYMVGFLICGAIGGAARILFGEPKFESCCPD